MTNRNVIALFEALSGVLPAYGLDWSIEHNEARNIVVLRGPAGAQVTIKLSASPSSTSGLMVGSWPNNHGGERMDPYSWGILSIGASYPLARIDLSQHSKFLKRAVRSFISIYEPIYKKCLAQSELGIAS